MRAQVATTADRLTIDSAAVLPARLLKHSRLQDAERSLARLDFILSRIAEGKSISD